MAKTLLPYQEVIFEQGMEQGVLADACESILDILEERFLVGSQFSEREDYYNH